MPSTFRAFLTLMTLSMPVGLASAQTAGEWSNLAPPPPPPSATVAPTKENASAVVAPAKENVVASPARNPGTLGNGLTAMENLRTTSGSTGATGLLRLGSADLGPAGLVRLSLTGEFFTKNDFPVTGAKNTHSAGTLAIDWTFHRYGEAYFAYAASANTNTMASPKLMQTQGDMRLGLKGGLEVFQGATIAADVAVTAYPGIGGQDVHKYAFGFIPRLLATYDVRRRAPRVPVRIHLNAGAAFDSTGDLVDKQSPTPTSVQEFALGINRYNRLAFGAGLELPLPIVTPFIEYNLAIPLSVSTLIGPDIQHIDLTSALPQDLGFGVKVTALRDISLLLACEIGLTQRVAIGVPATPPYNVVVGVSYAFDPMAKSQVIDKIVTVETQAKPPAPSKGKLTGIVLDRDTHRPVAGVVVNVPGSGLPPVATDADAGLFLTHEFPAGKISLALSREGYQPQVLEASVVAGKTGAVEALLVREPKMGTVAVTLTSGKVKAAGKVAFHGPKDVVLEVAAQGAAIELPNGHYSATVQAEEYLSKIQELDVLEGGQVALGIELAPKPKQSLVVVKDDRIQIRQQIHFATGKAAILADSFQLLDQVIDAIVRNEIKKVRIEGHTDNQGVREANVTLSQSRAAAVADYLVHKGIDRARLTSEGFGDSKPVAPNLTAKGRELNRRVEFMIVER